MGLKWIRKDRKIMQIIERKTESKVSNTNELLHCQASFNSDGNITLRHYNPYHKESDEILVFSHQETRAIFKLFSKIKSNIKEFDLPF